MVYGVSIILCIAIYVCMHIQVRLILEIEDTMSVLRYYAKFLRRLFTQKHTWYDFLLGSTRIERREAELKEWEQNQVFQQLKNDLVRF